MKKILTFILAIVMIATMIPAIAVGAAEGATLNTTTVGTVADQEAAEAACAAEGYTAVSTLEEWNAMTAGNYYLAEDIVVPAGQVLHTTTKIGGNFNLDGCGHIISGVNQEHALISISGNRTLSVKNIRVLNAKVDQQGEGTDSNYDENGAILIDGVHKSYIDIDNVCVTGNLTVAEGFANYSALMVGYLGTGNGATVTNSYVAGSITVNDASAISGGFFGMAAGTEVKFVNCVSDVDITNTHTEAIESYGSGGFVGNAAKRIIFEDCINKGDITSKNLLAGGFVGAIRQKSPSQISMKISNCVNEGNISSNIYAGGFAGKTDSTIADNEINNFINKGRITSDKSAGGILGRLTGTVLSSEDMSLMTIFTNLTINKSMNYGMIESKCEKAGAFVGEVAPAGDSPRVAYLSIRDSGNVGSLVHANKTLDSGAFVGAALRTDGRSKVTISNCFNYGPTDTEKTCAAVYNFSGEDGDVTVTDFYYLDSAGYSRVANSSFVTVGNSRGATKAEFASGEIAYLLGYNFGQTLGTDEYPKVGGDIVEVAGDGDSYVNLHTLSTGENGAAKAYVQMTEVGSDGKQKVRFILVLDEEALLSATTAEMKITFKKTGSADVSKTLTDSEIKAFRSVIADQGRYLTGEGSVLLGAVVTDVVAESWTSVSVEFTAKDGNNANIDLLSVGGTASK